MVAQVYPRKKFSGKRWAPLKNSSSVGQNHAHPAQDFGQSGWVGQETGYKAQASWTIVWLTMLFF